MKKLIVLSIAAVSFVGCSHDMGNYNEAYIDVSKLQDKDPNEVTKEDIQANVSSIFGTIDPNQDWNLLSQGSVSITADAPLDDIVKVQLLTESPFFNEDARVLNEAAVKNGETVTLTYDAPNAAETLVAACVNDKNVYYIQAFTPGTASISFVESSGARTRSTSYDLPADNVIKLDFNNVKKSFNALRAEAAQESALLPENNGIGYVGVYDNVKVKGGGTEWTYTQWNDGSWLNDRLWQPINGQAGSWTIENGSIYRSTSEIDANEAETLKKVINDFLIKNGTSGNRNNIIKIRESQFFSLNDNYLTTNGKSPIILTPVQLNSSEYTYNEIYYYYFKESEIEGMSDEEVANFVKALPKYKAIDIKSAGMSASIPIDKGSDQFFKSREYLLPFYGDGIPQDGNTIAKPIFDKGYKIGFLNRKDFKEWGDFKNSGSGCTYGDGRLNDAVNHLKGHYLSAIDKTLSFQTRGGSTLSGGKKNGLLWNDPRIVIFSANGKTYMCFEDGADCNFCDMIVEVNGGTEEIEEKIEILYISYTMCFEDSPIADYDMNDVVLKFERTDQTHINVSLMACGAYDELYLRGLNGKKLNETTEIHAIFGVDNTKTFINTGGGETKEPVSELFEITANSRMSEFMEKMYLYDKTKDYDVTLAGMGDDPHAIVIPADFEYPTEKTNINTAYPLFDNWASNATSDRYWFRNAIEEYIYKKK